VLFAKYFKSSLTWDQWTSAQDWANTAARWWACVEMRKWKTRKSWCQCRHLGMLCTKQPQSVHSLSVHSAHTCHTKLFDFSSYVLRII